jgi:hypothetical protein
MSDEKLESNKAKARGKGKDPYWNFNFKSQLEEFLKEEFDKFDPTQKIIFGTGGFDKESKEAVGELVDARFDWSERNSISEREEYGEKLAKYVKKVVDEIGQKISNHKEIKIHLISHSHGGQLLNEMVNNIEEQYLNNIQSLTYLSTPFFTGGLHRPKKPLSPTCKVVNVYNEFDLTQFMIADFSVHSLYQLIGQLEKSKEGRKIKSLKDKLDEISKVNIALLELDSVSKLYLILEELVSSFKNLLNNTEIKMLSSKELSNVNNATEKALRTLSSNKSDILSLKKEEAELEERSREHTHSSSKINKLVKDKELFKKKVDQLLSSHISQLNYFIERLFLTEKGAQVSSIERFHKTEILQTLAKLTHKLNQEFDDTDKFVSFR